MAFSVRLTGIERQSGKRVFQMDPSWWPAKMLKEDLRMKESVTDGYLNYQATLSVVEARALHERFRPEASKGVFGSASWQDIILPMLAELDAVFGSRSGEFSEFEVCVFEWESVLG